MVIQWSSRRCGNRWKSGGLRNQQQIDQQQTRNSPTSHFSRFSIEKVYFNFKFWLLLCWCDLFSKRRAVNQWTNGPAPVEYLSSKLIRAVALLSKVIATFHHFLLLFIIFVFKELLHHSYDSHAPRGVLLFRSNRTESSRIKNKQQQEKLKAEAEKQPVITFLITDGPVKGRMHLENCKKQSRTRSVGWTSSVDWRRSYRRASESRNERRPRQ